MVVLAASICTRGGKAVLSRQFRDMPRSRIEALLASLPKLADSGTQHTTVEQDNVRFVYQPLDELYMVLITNRQSNILQDIDSLHLFAQVVASACRTLDEREILRNAYELLSAFDEIVTLGYRDNLTVTQIRTFLEMESHEERVQEIIARNKELEATEERKRKAKQLEMQRKDAARLGASRTGVPRTPTYQSYQSPSSSAVNPYDSYEAEKNKTYTKASALKGKGMQLGKKSKTTDMFERVRGDMGGEIDDTPLVAPTAPATSAPAETHGSSTTDRDAVHVTISEYINTPLSRDGNLGKPEILGDLTLKVSDASMTKIKLALQTSPSEKAEYKTHPKIDRPIFDDSKILQMKNTASGFLFNKDLGVLKWKVAPKKRELEPCPITFTIWIDNDSSKYNITVEYELTGGSSVADVSVVIPYRRSKPVVSSSDASYSAAGNVLEWRIGTVDDENSQGSFEFEAEAADEDDFFPMSVRFSKATSTPHHIDVSSVSLVEDDEEVTFSKEIKSNQAKSESE